MYDFMYISIEVEPGFQTDTLLLLVSFGFSFVVVFCLFCFFSMGNTIYGKSRVVFLDLKVDTEVTLN